MAARFHDLCEQQLGELESRQFRRDIEAIESHLENEEEVLAVRIVALGKAIRPTLMAITERRLLFWRRRFVGRGGAILDVPAEAIADVHTTASGDKYMVARILVDGGQPIELMMGRRVGDRERIVRLIRNLSVN